MLSFVGHSCYPKEDYRERCQQEVAKGREIAERLNIQSLKDELNNKQLCTKGDLLEKLLTSEMIGRNLSSHCYDKLEELTGIAEGKGEAIYVLLLGRQKFCEHSYYYTGSYLQDINELSAAIGSYKK